MVPFTWQSRTSKTNTWWQKADQWLPGAGTGEGFNWDGAHYRVKDMFLILFRMLSQVYTFVKTHLIIHLKWVHFVAYKLYGNEVNFKSKKKEGNKTKLTPITKIKENHSNI